MTPDPSYIAIAVIGSLFLAWLVLFHDSEGMWPNYDYDSRGNVLNSTMSLWQSSTQGGIPNFVEGRLPDGSFTGRYDYLGRNFTGQNVIPGNFYKDCGCGCAGEKAAVAAVSTVAAGKTSPQATPISSIKTQEGYSTERNSRMGRADYAPGPFERLVKSITSGFSNAPMDAANLCGKGVKGTMGGRCSEGFGANPNWLAQTAETVGNYSRMGTGSIYHELMPIQSEVAKYSEEIQLANMATANAIASSGAMASTAKAIAMSDQYLADVPTLNIHQDSPLNGPRRAIYHADLGKYEGQNIVSAFDGRTR